MRPKRILIISASIGDGHIQAACTLQKEMMQYNDCCVNVVDFLESARFDYPKLNRLQMELMQLVKLSYYGMLKTAPRVYKGLYVLTANSRTSKLIQFINAANQKIIEKLIVNYRPDVILCTHPFPLGAASHLRNKKHLKYMLAGVITDFVAHQWWIANEVDRYFVANREIKQELVFRGIRNEAIRITGIPVGRGFYPIDKSSINTPKLLVMGGGLGMGRMELVLRITGNSSQAIEITVLTGKNADLKNRLESLSATFKNRINILPFVNNVAALMRQSDLLVTKPGGLTCSEALATNLPMILFDPLPGQEEDNAEYLVRQGAALWARNEKDVASIIKQVFFEETIILNTMQQQCRKLSNYDAADVIASDLYILAGGAAERIAGL
ncbi:MAG: galactosyldiacylglycerol synthase [Pelosinus sp.]|nr:galactosyldiacylglycerol synthase [Pelosinus sp.]